jgi:hypothetical protein
MPRLSASPDAVLFVLVVTLQAQNSYPLEVAFRNVWLKLATSGRSTMCTLGGARLGVSFFPQQIKVFDNRKPKRGSKCDSSIPAQRPDDCWVTKSIVRQNAQVRHRQRWK